MLGSDGNSCPYDCTRPLVFTRVLESWRCGMRNFARDLSERTSPDDPRILESIHHAFAALLSKRPGDRGGASSLLAPVGAALIFDHGVQAFTVEAEAGRDVEELVEGWVLAGHAQAWEGAFGLLDASTGRFAPSAQPADDDALFGPLVSTGQRYVGVPTMAALVSGMLETAAAEAEAAAAGASLTMLWGCKARAITP